MKDSISEKLDALLSRGVMRHIQRGTIYPSSEYVSTDGSTLKATLAGFTDSSKMIVLLDAPWLAKRGDNSVLYYLKVYSLTESELTLALSESHYVNRRYIEYQVIEFY